MINYLVGANVDADADANANANADTNDWMKTKALLDFVRRAKTDIIKRNVVATHINILMPLNTAIQGHSPYIHVLRKMVSLFFKITHLLCDYSFCKEMKACGNVFE